MKTYENPALCRDQRYDGMTRPIVIMNVCDSYLIQRQTFRPLAASEDDKPYGEKKCIFVQTAFGENL